MPELMRVNDDTSAWLERRGKAADKYVLATVPFAIVSLFAGLSTKFVTPGFRTAIVGMAFIVFLIAAVALAFMPVT